MKPFRLLSVALGLSLSLLAFFPVACGDSSNHPLPVDTDKEGGNVPFDVLQPPPVDATRDLSVPDVPVVVDSGSDADSAVDPCKDGIKDGLETDVDCGGGVCPKCIDKKACIASSDCVGNSCVAADGGTHVCVTPSCTDGVKNGAETDVDCGGGTCPKCSFGKGCGAAADCVSGACTANGAGNSCTCPAGMTIVATSAALGGAYCVDETEVQNGQYNAFITANQPIANQIPVCSTNLTFVPQGQWPPPQPLSSYGLPVRYVDWCDAYAYCSWAGKQLCGMISGGSYAPTAQNNQSVSAWYNACSAQGVNKYPYDVSTFNPTVCNSGSAPPMPIDAGPDGGDAGFTDAGPPASAWYVWSYNDQGGNNNQPMNVSCQGGSVNLFQMSGNVAEWEDSCSGATGPNDTCLLRGGSYTASQNPAAVACDASRSAPRLGAGSVAADIGFRCCQY